MKAPLLITLVLFAPFACGGSSTYGNGPAARDDAAAADNDNDDMNDGGSEPRDGGATGKPRDGGTPSENDANVGKPPPTPTGTGTPPLPPPSGKKRVFITDGQYTGNLKIEGAGADGPSGADNICQTEATAAGLSGTFKAWLSVPGTKAPSRHAMSAPWVRVDGAAAFPGVAILGSPVAPIDVTAKGLKLGTTDNPSAWTGTYDDGEVATSTCTSWTSASSSSSGAYGDATDKINWSLYYTESCSQRLRLYCFEQ